MFHQIPFNFLSTFSLFSITDGKNIAHCPPIQDYKRAYENNQGPNDVDSSVN